MNLITQEISKNSLHHMQDIIKLNAGEQKEEVILLFGGNGAYTTGNIYLEKGQKLYVYVGQSGGNLQKATFNGGGQAGTMYYARAGGGATDVRLEAGDWNGFESLKSRIMVAGRRRRLSFRRI